MLPDRTVPPPADASDVSDAPALLPPEAFAAVVYEGVTDALVLFDADLRYVHVNARASALFGRPAESLLGRAHLDVYPEAEGLVFHRAYERVLRTGRPEVFEAVFGPWGQRFENRVLPLGDAPARGIAVFFRVVPDAATPATAVPPAAPTPAAAPAPNAFTAEHLRTIVEAAPDGIAVVAPDGTLVSCNDAAVGLLGRSDRRGLRGAPVATLVAPAHRDALAQALAATLAGRGVRLEVPVAAAPDGPQAAEAAVLDVRTAPLRDASGAVVAALAFARDVTAQRAAERTVRDNEALFQAVFTGVTAMVWRWELATGEVHRLGSLASGLGFPPDVVPADGPDHAAWWLARVHPDDRAANDARMAAIAAGEVDRLHAEYRMRRRDGSWATLATRLQVERDAAGRPVRVVGLETDITAQVEARTRQLETERRLRVIAEGISDALWLGDPSGETLHANPAHARLLGRAMPALGDLRDAWFDAIHVDDRARVMAAWTDWGHETEVEYRLVRPDGEVRRVQTRLFRVQADDGTPGGMAAVTRDVTEAHRLDERVRESEARFRQLAENIRQVFWMSRLDDRQVLYLSPAFEEIWGVSREAVYAEPRRWLDAIHPDDRPRVLAANAPEALDAGGFDLEYRVQRPDGRERWVHDRGFPVRDAAGRVYRVAGIAEDVTERRAAATAAHASERRFQTLFEHAADAISIHDGAGRIVDGNARLAELLGYTRDELRGMRVATLEPTLTEAELQAIWSAMTPGETRTVQTSLRHRDGTVIPFEARLTVIDDGERLFYVLLRDVRERQALETQLRQAQRMEAVGQLAGGVAHDFNNLLTVIQGHARFALEGVTPGGPLHDDLAAVLDAAERAAGLTRQLLAFSRKQLLRPRVLDLNAVVRALEPMLRRLIGEDIRVTTQLAPALGQVTADPTQLEQVLLNLAINARDAMPHGGTLTIATTALTLDGTGAPGPGGEGPAAGPYVRLTVRDTGVGMDEATRARAFEPFFTTKEPGKGTGLGLATVYGIVRQSGGWIRLASQPGRGTTVEVDLPRTGPTPDADASPGADAPARGRGTVLVVEDQPEVRRLARRILAGGGYTVLEAPNGREALTVLAARGGQVDLVLSDVVMPEMGGRALAERLAAEWPAVRLLFMSGYTDDEIVRRGLRMGERAYVEKPFTPASLLAAVRSALDA